MSRYDDIAPVLARFRAHQRRMTILPTIAMGFLVMLVPLSMAAKLVVTLVMACALPFILHRVWCGTSSTYRERVEQAKRLDAEVHELRRIVTRIQAKYREREKGEHFKGAYLLCGRQLRGLEEAIAVGMYRERREVFVTAFMRDGVAIRVTAAIGTPFRCRPKDDPSRWREHAIALGCDEVRQYHNHPVYDGVTTPSPADLQSADLCRRLLGDVPVRSLILCWNAIGEWKIFQHDERERFWLDHDFDAVKTPDGEPDALDSLCF